MTTDRDRTTDYDPAARRDTPLARELRAEIRANGALPVDAFVARCLLDETYGYYRTHQPFGTSGDFVTAPDISQVFGELLGAWVAVAWQQMGSPDPFRLVELGPGRGTLMQDMLRVLQRVPALSQALTIELVDASPVLQRHQRDLLSDTGFPITWSDGLPAVNGMASVLIANEFLDCMPPVQIVRTPDSWQVRGVGLDADGSFTFTPAGGTGNAARLDAAYPGAAVGSIIEIAPTRAIAAQLAALATAAPMAALFIDYGSSSASAPDGRLGDTLQAVRNHAYEHPFTSPGEADLTCQVDFAAYARAFRAAGLAVDGPTTQAAFLGTLGIIERASRLMSANPALVGEIEAGVMRLMAPNGMGSRFKVLGIRVPHMAQLPGFDATES